LFDVGFSSHKALGGILLATFHAKLKNNSVLAKLHVMQLLARPVKFSAT